MGEAKIPSESQAAKFTEACENAEKAIHAAEDIKTCLLSLHERITAAMNYGYWSGDVSGMRGLLRDAKSDAEKAQKAMVGLEGFVINL